MRLCKVEVEMGVTWPRGKEHWEAQGAGGDQEGLSPGSLEKARPCRTPGFQACGSGTVRHISVGLSPPVCDALFRQIQVSDKEHELFGFRQHQLCLLLSLLGS